MPNHNTWYQQAREQTLDTLPEFINELANHVQTNNSTHAIAAACIGTAWAMNASNGYRIPHIVIANVARIFNRLLAYRESKCGIKTIDYDYMLYPYYNDVFTTIPEDTWRAIQTEAQRLLDTTNHETWTDDDGATHIPPDQEIFDHWQSIVDGRVPFGFRVKEE